jgi:hypothetical protein
VDPRLLYSPELYKNLFFGAKNLKIISNFTYIFPNRIINFLEGVINLFLLKKIVKYKFNNNIFYSSYLIFLQGHKEPKD